MSDSDVDILNGLPELKESLERIGRGWRAARRPKPRRRSPKAMIALLRRTAAAIRTQWGDSHATVADALEAIAEEEA